MPGIEDHAATRAARARNSLPPDVSGDDAAHGSFAGRAVSTQPNEPLAGSVRVGPSAHDHDYEDVVPRPASGPGRSAAATSADALEPLPMPVRQPRDLRKRWVRIGTGNAVPGRSGGTGNAVPARPGRSGGPGVARPAQALRLLPHAYERPLPSAGASLERHGSYLVNSLDEGRIPREMKDDLEAALLYANRLDSDRERLATASAGPDGASLMAGERDALEATHVGEMSRIHDLLEGCAEHEDATPEARAFARGLQERIGQAYTALTDLVAAHDRQPDAEQPQAAADRPATELEDFVTAASRSRRANAHVTLTGDGQATVTTGRLARWRSGRRVAANRATAEQFVAALRARFGDEIADQVASSDGVQRAVRSGRALESQHINDAVFRARRLVSDYREANDRLLRTFTEPDASGVSATDRKVAEASQRLADHGMRGVASLVDSEALARIVSRDLAAAAGAGKHLVTTEEAGRIVETAVGRALLGTYEAERTDAMEKLALGAPESMFARSLASAAGSQGQEFDLARLEPGTARDLASRMDAAVRSLDAASLVDDAALEGAATEVATNWVAERQQSVAALADTGLDEAAHGAMAAQVARDQTPPALVPHLAAAYGELQGDLERLGGPLGADGLQTALVRIHDGVVQAVRDGGIAVDVDNQDEVYAQCWRALLAPGGQAGFEAIADQFEPGAGLREFTEGLGWITRRFPLTEEGAAATTTGGDRGEIEIAGTPMSVLNEYQALAETLSNVVTDAVGRPGEIADPEDLGDLSTDALDVLRQMDFPLPGRWADPDAGQ